MKKTTHLLFILLLLASLIVCVSVGSVNVALEDLVHSFRALLTGASLNNQYDRIIYFVRLPRVLTTALVGAMLALAGTIMQSVLKNPLADASTLGLTSGASLGAAIAIITGFQIPQLPYSGTAFLASLFALGALFIILSLAQLVDKKMTNTTVILMGIIFTMLSSAVLSLLLVIFNDKAQSIIFWSMGSLAGANYDALAVLSVVFIIFTLLAMTQRKELNAFSMGEEAAYHLGVSVKKSRLLLFFCVAFLVGHAVAATGSIAFVGLIIPHMARRLFGANHRVLLPASLYMGAIFLLYADLLARTLVPPREIPIGILTSIIGTIVFIWIFVRQKQGGVS